MKEPTEIKQKALEKVIEMKNESDYYAKKAVNETDQFDSTTWKEKARQF